MSSQLRGVSDGFVEPVRLTTEGDGPEAAPTRGVLRATGSTNPSRYTNRGRGRLMYVKANGQPVFAPVETGAACPVCDDLAEWGQDACGSCGARLA